MKKSIITIAGSLGGGKSSTAELVAKHLGYTHASTGDFMREMAEKRGVSLSMLGSMAENDETIDKALDEYNLDIGKMEKVVLDSRLGFYFIPSSYKVFLDLNPEVAAERILEDKKNNPNRKNESSESFDTKESIKDSIISRLVSEKKRYKSLYGIEDHIDQKNFDLVLNTEIMSVEEVSQKIVDGYTKWQQE